MAIRYLLIALVVLGLTGFSVTAWVALHPAAPPAVVADVPPPPPPPVMVTVLSAARPLRAGALVVPDDITTAEVAASTVPPDQVGLTKADLIGGMVRRAMPIGAPLRAPDVLRPRDRGFLAAVLGPGMRAISVGVDAVSGAAGLIWPGDRVDVVLTQTIDDATQPASRRVSGETVLQALRVIAIDQQLMQGAVAADTGERAARTVTLEVTPAQAERVAVASRLGKLALVVHAADADTQSDAPAVTWAGDVSPALREGRDMLRVYRGPDKAEEVHF